MIVGIETGGTKVVCAIARSGTPSEPVDVRRFPTTTPVATLTSINRYLEDVEVAHGVDAVGIASFGPLNVDPARPGYGRITGTSKPGWADVDLIGGIAAADHVPVAVMSDVTGAAVGEARWGAGRHVGSLAYSTFGTGVGVGVVVGGVPVQGNGFPELGHLLVRRHPADRFSGACAFHGDCAEGLVSGPAVLERWGTDGSHLPSMLRDEALDVLGFYVSQIAAAAAYAHGVERVVLGGGVMRTPGLLDAARRALPSITGGERAGHAIGAQAAEFLVPPQLDQRSGVFGALAAAADLVDGGSGLRAAPAVAAARRDAAPTR